MGPPQPAKGIISIEALTRPIAVDHRISLPYYFRIAGTLLRQAKIYRDEKNILDLYIILLRYASLLCETIPEHRDYPIFKSREAEFVRNANYSTLIDVVNELESLKPIVKQQIFEHNRRGTPEANGLNGTHAANHSTEKNLPTAYSTQPFVGSNNGPLQKFSPDGRHHRAPLPSVQTNRQIRKQYVYLQFVFMSMICCVFFSLATNCEGEGRQIRKQYVYLLFVFMSMICCAFFSLATNCEGEG